ncbi:hypothetical protein GCM10007937_52120 [Mesorhizobium albiziae]|nr:hypothetical protein GCM10007937_52120 [Mesorhizobium albiziae]
MKPKGRGASVRKAQNRYKDSLRVSEERQARVDESVSQPIDLQQAMQDALAAQSPLSKAVDLHDAFARAADDGKSGAGQASGMRARLPRSRSRGRRGRESADGGVAGMMRVGRRGRARPSFAKATERQALGFAPSFCFAEASQNLGPSG